jgi:2-polyprenyl-3-methyl-5-hydroxy-6-metoxy-1,4-benzoquinol methylase
MKKLDLIIQSWRINKARKYILKDSLILDIGCSDGILFKCLNGYIRGGLGIDPLLIENIINDKYRLIKGYFPKDIQAEDCSFDIITALAVVEHIPLSMQTVFAKACFQYLKPGGRLIISIPSPLVDKILSALLRLRVIDGMSVEEHYGFDGKLIPGIYCNERFELFDQIDFELRLNHIYVFHKPQL